VAATLSMQLVEDILRILGDRYRSTVTPRETRPRISAALAPPGFMLGLEPLDRNRPPTGGERR
jgi:hypothetical protein